MKHLAHYLSMILLGLSLFLAPISFAKGEKTTISPKLYKKLKKVEQLIENKKYTAAAQSLKAIHNKIKKGGFEEASVLRSLASAYSMQNSYKKAAQALLQSLQLNALPNEQQLAALLNLGQLYLASEQYQKATKPLVKWLAKKGNGNSQVYIMLAKAHAQLKQYKQAIPYVEKAIANSKAPIDLWYQLQLVLYIETKNYAKATRVLEKLVRKYPKSHKYWSQLAALYQQVNQYTKAVTIKNLAYEKGILISEKEIIDLVNLFLYVNVPYKAGKILAKEIKLKHIKSNSKNWELLANAWTQAREFKKALSALDTASKLNNKGQLFQRMGSIYIEQEQWSLAASALNKAITKGGLRQPGNAYLLLGLSYYEQKKIDKARSSFNKAKNYKESQKAARQWLNYIST